MSNVYSIKPAMRERVATKPLAEQLRVSIAVERARKRNVEVAAAELGKARNALNLCASCEAPLQRNICWHPERGIAFCIGCGTKGE